MKANLVKFSSILLYFFSILLHKFNSLFHKKKYWSNYKILLLSCFLFHCGQLRQVVTYSTTGYQ